MGLFDRFKKQQNTGFHRKEAPQVIINKINAYDGKTNRRYKDYAKDGYQENAIVYKCISMIANNASSVPICVYSGDQKLESHPLLGLLTRPNPLQSQVEYFHSMISYLLISGNTYMLRDKEVGAPSELYLLRPDRMHIKATSSMIPEYYCYKVDNKLISEYPVDKLTGLSQVKHVKLWNPLDDFYGLSPIVASAYNIDQHNLAGLHNVGLLKNGCTPSAMLKFQPKDETGMSASLTDDQRATILEDLESRFRGANNSGRPLLLEGDFDYVQMGLNPKDMDFMELMNMSAREIALCFGVPAQLVGIADQTYANVAEARLSLYEETIIPLLERIESDLNEWLAPLYSENLSLKYDIDAIPAMAEKRKQIFANVSMGVEKGIITRNEARERLGLKPIDGGDSLLVPSNLFPLGEISESAEETERPVDADGNEKYDEQMEMAYGTKAMIATDVFDNEEEAEQRATAIGCTGTHTMEVDGATVYMPCATHDRYDELVGEKALSDLNLKPSEGMKAEAKRGLDWRKEFNRGGTQVGATRANQLINGVNLSPDTVLRMFSFFSRHESDKTGQGFKQGQKGYPSAGRIAWALWGGDSGFSWSRGKRNQIMREREKSISEDVEIKAEADALKVGDMVSWDSSGGRAKGKITRIVRSGKLSVPKTTFTLNATEDNPACLIRVYRGEDPTETIVGHRFATLRKL
tara:strand:- start:9108 stop:11186 length:2079 start_codon:yes stop_codon:yes gene_type:complete